MPTLIHTGVHSAYDDIRKAIREVLDPARLANVVLLHFEGDECGGMERFMAEARSAQLVASDMSAVLNLTAFGVAYVDRVRGVRDGDTIDLGEHTLRFLETPHVHHWDSMMVVEETTRSLFPSDLFIQPGDQPPVVNEDLDRRDVRLLPRDRDLRPRGARCAGRSTGSSRSRREWVHAMHGGTLTAEIFPRYVQRAARASRSRSRASRSGGRSASRPRSRPRRSRGPTYLPWNRALRFWRKALMPSRASSDPNTFAKPCFSAAMPSSRSPLRGDAS